MTRIQKNAPVVGDAELAHVNDDDLADEDASSSFRILNQWRTPRTIVVAAIALAWVAFQIYVSIWLLAVPTMVQRCIHLGFGMMLASAVLAAASKSRILTAVFYVLGAAGMIVELMAAKIITDVTYSGVPYSNLDFVLAIIGLVVLLTLSWRVIGAVLPILGILFMALALFGDALPGILRMVPSNPFTLINKVYYGSDGVHGIPLDASNRYIFIFVIFGAFLTQFGAADVLVRVASKWLSKTRGGAGKLAVVSSALFGMTSDSSAANITTTGSVTIPLMKRTGFKPEVAAGVEAAGGVGGLLVPPVMGSVAFIMVVVTGIPYGEIIIAAIIPAVLYYAVLFVSVDRVAARQKIGGFVYTGSKRSLKDNIWDAIEFGAPIVILFMMLVVMHVEPTAAGVNALGALIVLHLIRYHSVQALLDCVKAAIIGAQRAVIITLITAVVGVLIGPILSSGLGLNVGAALVSLGAANVVLLLLVTVLASVVLGSGLPGSATYIFLAVLVAPALGEFGLPLIAVHMFILYMGTMADLSPPTMASVFVASGLAESKPMKTSLYAMAFGLGGFIVPFMFVFRPEMLIVDATVWNVTLSLIAACAGLFLLIAGAIGYGRRYLILPVRLVAVVCGLLCIVPNPIFWIPAAVIGLALVIWSPFSRRFDKDELGATPAEPAVTA
jgi:TRAP transporter 4TM/12TM fusion protein